MRRPSARVGRNRRRAMLWLPLFVVGAVAVLFAGALLNGLWFLAAVVTLIGAVGIILEDAEVLG